MLDQCSENAKTGVVCYYCDGCTFASSFLNGFLNGRVGVWATLEKPSSGGLFTEDIPVTLLAVATHSWYEKYTSRNGRDGLKSRYLLSSIQSSATFGRTQQHRKVTCKQGIPRLQVLIRLIHLVSDVLDFHFSRFD